MNASLSFAFLMGQPPLELFKHGGPIMWPIIVVSFLAITVVVERALFLLRENAARDPKIAGRIFERVENHDVEGAVRIGEKSRDFIARILVYALTHKESSLDDAFAQASSRELSRYQQGLAILDTCITAAPLLGLLGTVTGMMNTFGALGGGDIAASAGQITGGVGEALIATASGLVIAIVVLFPFNVLNTRIEQARRDIADAANALELVSQKAGVPNLTLTEAGAGV
ncbi:MotA/TolQ/ExbB proton channel family protein [Opitutaceae bacterium TAV4]|uniref:MotA/TolQ/ExbB proton channel family protein n=1 Tax=Geminisphaera colitermitum TaxID=1148786 RepID=UPI000196500D|nr:MotA/TolQ/ExbB proton channel family protein [Geminisphaera colitermitum]RRJ96665.1 MotA/TolQ/ExbB proton channel family protein [Opitutaceae bacterium TAV4]RRK00714.1 MotA/TolQ/ExbB proton channel family protein [Opitutaceae bacterium TAV3]